MDPASGVDLREMVRILRRRWRPIVATPVLLMTLALLAIMILPARYSGVATVLIDPHRSSVADQNQGQQPPSNFATDDATIESQVLLVQSLAVLQHVVDKLDLTHDEEFAPHPGLLDPIRALFATHTPAPGASKEDIARMRSTEILQTRTKVTRQATTFLVDIAVSSESPKKAAAIANAIADAYFEDQVHAKYDAVKTAADWLNSEIKRLEGRVVASDKAVEDFRAANNLTVSQGVTVNDQQITDLNNKLVEARVESAATKAKYDQVQQISQRGGDPGSIGEALQSDVIARLRTQYAEIAKNEADLRAKYGPQHPSVPAVHAQLRDTQRLINQEVQRILDNTRHDYEVARSREASLQKSLDDLKGISTRSGQAQVQLRELQRQADANRSLYESFLARYKETSAQENLELPESRIVTRAQVPIRPSFPKPMLMFGLALLAGLGIGCFLAFLRDFLDRRIKTTEQAEELSRLPTIAAIPLIGSRELARRAKQGRWALGHYDPETVSLLPPPLQPPIMRYAIEEPTSIFAEAVRSIRLAVQRTARMQPLKTIMVTSAIDGEAKTTTACNLALSLSILGARTLLVDADMRNPELTRSLCPRAQVGLFEVAIGQVPIEQAIMVERASSLAVLPCSPPESSAALTEFVSSEVMRAALDRLRGMFDVIIVDAPPVVPLIDARALAEHADRIILTIAWDRTPQDVVAQALELLAPVYDRMLGTVLTRVDMRRLRHYDYYRSSAYLRPYAYGHAPAQEAAE
ncbi:MAG TPA: polysaccharide biosynthesis tyrosine autokinase [Pseudolabrys sp.]|nr:polysaccharide biosynthesis tyrosine autokinase [Pseudolabrys sp.]